MDHFPSPPRELDDLVERFDHVSIAAWDLRDVLPLIDMIGGTLRNGGVAAGGFRWAQWYLPGAGKVEVVAPLDRNDESHFLTRFLTKRGPGLHHLTFKVRSIEAAITRARESGFDVVDVNIDGSGWREAFLHPRSASGVLIQLAEWTDHEPPPDVTIQAILEA